MQLVAPPSLLLNFFGTQMCLRGRRLAYHSICHQLQQVVDESCNVNMDKFDRIPIRLNLYSGHEDQEMGGQKTSDTHDLSSQVVQRDKDSS